MVYTIGKRKLDKLLMNWQYTESSKWLFLFISNSGVGGPKEVNEAAFALYL